MKITLRMVSGNAWREALALSVHPGQRRYISRGLPPVMAALFKTYLRWRGQPLPLGVYLGDRMIGFLLWTLRMKGKVGWIDHFFIDKHSQGNGFGTEALRLLIDRAWESIACSTICLMVDPENLPARLLYLDAGFLETRDKIGSKLVYKLSKIDAKSLIYTQGIRHEID